MMLFQSSSRISFSVGRRVAAKQAAPKAAIAANSTTRHGLFDVLFRRSSAASSSFYCNNSTIHTATTIYNNNKVAFLSTSTTATATSSDASSATSDTDVSILSKLCHVNISILQQKLSLIEVLKTKFGLQQAKELYKTPCPLVGNASIGQHVRHSIDHIEKIVNVLKQSSSQSDDEDIVVRYDIRTRGGTDEHDIDEAQKRIENIMNILQRHVTVTSVDDESSSSSSSQQEKQQLHLQSMKSCFMLSGSDSHEYELHTTIGRELGFVVHHAIHHLALVKIIVTQPKMNIDDEVDSDPRCHGIIGLSANDLPTDFGTAPSTINYYNNDMKKHQ